MKSLELPTITPDTARSLIPHDMLYGPQAALLAEELSRAPALQRRSLGYQLSSVIAGGPAPLVAAAWLPGRYHSGMAIAMFILACSIVTLFATASLKDRTNEDISI